MVSISALGIQKRVSRVKWQLILSGVVFFCFLAITCYLASKLQPADPILALFTNPLPTVKAEPRLNVMLYLGESTSILNMGLYGYFRGTTPHLNELEKNKKGFLKFDEVFATHTQTDFSVLEALSIGVDEDGIFHPINRRRRISMVDILNEVGIVTTLIKQTYDTDWSTWTSVIFRNATKNISHRRYQAWHHEHFNQNVTGEVLNSESPQLIVFHAHSIGGREHYAWNIPKDYREAVDDFYVPFTKEALSGGEDILSSVEGYDAAIRYTDFAVSNALSLVEESNKPWVFVYTATQGEAVFANREHDSSQFIHEMGRVPFVVYFNAAAQKISPALFDEYSSFAHETHTSTLAQLPATIFDLLGVSVDASVITTPVIGSPSITWPIMVTDTLNGTKAVNVSSESLNPSLEDATNSAERHYLASKRFGREPVICYHRSNTIAKALRGSLITSCLEIDITVGESSELFAYHPPKKDTGLTLGHIVGLMNSKGPMTYWLDSKNLNSKKKCNALREYFDKQNHVITSSISQVLVEFPTKSHTQALELTDCITALTDGPIYSSYYVDTLSVVNCAVDLGKGYDFDGLGACTALKDDLLLMKESKLFTDISFDYGGLRAIQSIPFAADYNWNAWHVPDDALNSLDISRYRMILLRNKDPNNY